LREIVVDATRSEMAESLLVLEGNPYRLDGAPFYYDILDRGHRRLLMCTARQVFKSVTGAVDMLLDSVLIAHFKTMYVSPSRKQTKLFSKSRLQKLYEHSPGIKDITRIIQPSVWDKYYKNGSENYFTYTYDDPDRIRGYSTDSIKYDEMQDIIYKLVVPVVNETMAMSPYKKEYYAGTHKTLENPVNWLWSQSTQCIWLIKCTGCSKHNVLNSVANVGLKGPICKKCGKSLEPRLGFWYAQNLIEGQDDDDKLWGYHVSQLMLPKNNEIPREWRILRHKLDSYDDISVLNEVLGVPAAKGSRFIERSDLERQCRDYMILQGLGEPPPGIFNNVTENEAGELEVYAGIDWSGGGFASKSHTVLWIFGVAPGYKHFVTLFFKVYPTGEPHRDLEEIVVLLHLYKVRMVGADAGVGAHANSYLREKFGHERVIQLQYTGALQHFTQGPDRIMVSRTAAIDSFFLEVKRQAIYYPNKNLCEDVFDHVLSVFAMVTRGGHGRKIWNSSPGAPDDALHAQIFCWITARIGMGVIKLYGTPAEQDLEPYTGVF